MGTVPQSKGVKTRIDPGNEAKSMQPLHRLREIRAQQDVTLRALSRKMHVPMREVRAQEDPSCDLPLTALYRWQQALRVPAASLR